MRILDSHPPDPCKCAVTPSRACHHLPHYVLAILLALSAGPSDATGNDSILTVKKTADFQVTGDGNSPHWAKSEWVPITIQEHARGPVLATRVKLLYSDKGIYFLFACEDRKLTATLQEDFRALFREDVIEVFLWPDESVPIYFEYELSPLNYELAILVPNINGRSRGWRPWHYEGDRRVQHATSAQGGEKKSNSPLASWTGEIFIPFALLTPFVSSVPPAGSRWRANLYRIDYDNGYTTWTWQKTTYGKGGNFHEFRKFGTLIFE